MFVISAVLLFVAIYVAKLPAYCCNGGHEYRKINAYISTLWIPAYLIARNATPWLMDRVSAPMEWIGMHSLEFYLLQFHVFMTRESSMVLSTPAQKSNVRSAREPIDLRAGTSSRRRSGVTRTW